MSRVRLYWSGWAVTVALSLLGLMLLEPEPWGPLGLLLAALGVARATLYVAQGPLTGRMRWLRHGWPLAFGPILLAAGIAAMGGSWAWWIVAFAPVIAFRWSL